MFGQKKQISRDIEIEMPTGGRMNNSQFMGESEIKEATDMSEVIKEMFADEINVDDRTSSIDMKARLNAYEIMAILTIDTMVGFNVMPLKCMEFTRRKKRLSVSTDGEGRKEIVFLFHGNELRQQNDKSMIRINK
jgi:hypothetical protein